LLRYFGEEFAGEECGACDNCLSPRATYDGTLLAQKMLSCVYRIREKSKFSVGLGHVIEVLSGADTERIRKWSHQELSTYGIGREQSRSEWSAIGRELIRLGHLVQRPERFNVLEITEAGLAALKQRERIQLTRPMEKPVAVRPASGAIACDEMLFEQLRTVRKRLADERGVPPYIVFSDVALRQMARSYPTDAAGFMKISGVGDRKLAEFGEVFLKEIAGFLATHPRQIFADNSFERTPLGESRGSKLNGTTLQTLRLFRDGIAPEEIARRRALVPATIYGHLAGAIEAGEALDMDRIFNDTQQREIAGAFARCGYGNLTGVFDVLKGAFDIGQLRLYRAAAQRNAARA
jgi:ATP-dependent DNA helicase RecQ